MVVIVAAFAAAMSFLPSASAFMGIPTFSGKQTQVGLGRVPLPPLHPHVSMMAKMENVAAVVLAGGVGKRMNAGMEKQFIELDGKPVLDHSLDTFRSFKGVSQVIVVLDEKHRYLYNSLREKDSRVVFADPGKERQDSVFNALQKVDVDASMVCIHDSARPLVTKKCIRKVISDADEHGAAVLGVLMKVTVKESEDGEFVQRTIDRSRLWDIQTPQVVKPKILREGFERVKKEGWVVTDDASIVEQLGLPVKLTMGEYTNIKLTTPDDLMVASQILEERKKNMGTNDDDEDDDEEERLSVTRANAKWSDRPLVDTKPSTADQIENLSVRRANEDWGQKRAQEPVAAGVEDEGPENLSIKRANEVRAADSSPGGDSGASKSNKAERKTMRGRPPPENVSRNRIPPSKPEDMDTARAETLAKREGMWKDMGVAPPQGKTSPPASQNAPTNQTDIFSKEE